MLDKVHPYHMIFLSYVYFMIDCKIKIIYIYYK